MNSECEINCKYIDEVIIIGSPRKKDGRNSLTVGEDTGGGEWNQPKKCRDFMDCMPFPRYGGGNLPIPPPTQPPTPCEKGQKVEKNPELNRLMKELKEKVHSDAEEGFMFSYNGSNISQTRIVGEIGMAGIDINIPRGVKIDGIFHIHYDKLLSIFSILCR